MTGAAYAERKPKPTKWELGITFPGEDMLPLIPTLGSVFGAASSAIGHVASDIKTGKTTAGAVKKQWEPVKGAVDALAGVASQRASPSASRSRRGQRDQVDRHTDRDVLGWTGSTRCATLAAPSD